MFIADGNYVLSKLFTLISMSLCQKQYNMKLMEGRSNACRSGPALDASHPPVILVLSKYRLDTISPISKKSWPQADPWKGFALILNIHVDNFEA